MQSLRSFISRIEEAVPDQLVTVDGEVDSRYEITAYIQEMERRRENPGLIFNDVKGFDSPVAANLFGHIDRMNLAIGDSKVRNGRGKRSTSPPSPSPCSTSRTEGGTSPPGSWSRGTPIAARS